MPNSLFTEEFDTRIEEHHIATPPTPSSPAIIRGSADMASFPGVFVGSLNGTQDRIDNGARIQAFFDWCAANGKYADISPGLYIGTHDQTENSIKVGFQVKSGCPGVRGSADPLTGSRLIQCAVNNPVMTIGHVDANTGLQGGDFEGFTLAHGVSQTGQSNAHGLLQGRTWLCTFRHITVGDNQIGDFRPYDCFRSFVPNNQFDFTNQYDTNRFVSAQRSLMRLTSGGTGNVYNNTYLGGGTFGSRMVLSDAAVFAEVASRHLGVFNQLNIEWIEAYTMLRLDSTMGAVFNSLYSEGCKPTGWDASMIMLVGARAVINDFTMGDTWIGSAATGTPSIVRTDNTYFPNAIEINGFTGRWMGSGYNAEAVADVPFVMHNPGASRNYEPDIVVKHGLLNGNTGAFAFDSTMPAVANARVDTWREYKSSRIRSHADGATVTVTDSNYTALGIYPNLTVKYDAPLTATRTVIASHLNFGSGAEGNTWRQRGDQLRVTRTAAATGAFTLAINNATGGNIGSTGTADSNVDFVFGGRAFGAATVISELTPHVDVNAASTQNYSTENLQQRRLSHATGVAFTLNNNLPVGWVQTIIQGGAGPITFAAASGATLRHWANHTKTAGQYAEVTIRVVSNTSGTNAEYILSGSTAA